MRRQGDISPAQGQTWLAAMQQAFPDVKAGERITGLHHPETGARFWHQGRATAHSPVFWHLAGRRHQRAQTAQRLAGARRPMNPNAATQQGALAFGWRDGWRYGLMGLPLAFVALPVYVHLPDLYAQQYGVPLAALGGVLLLSRSIDAVVDPWLGRWGDRLY
eukprot:gene22640-42982_t